MKIDCPVRFVLRGLGAERLFSLMHDENIRIRDVRRLGRDEVSGVCAGRDAERVRRLAEEKGCAYKDGQRMLWQRAAVFMKKRWLVCVGVLATAAILYLSTFWVWQVRVEGAGKYLGEINQFLLSEGIGTGTRKSKIDSEKIADALMWRFPQVLWVKCEVKGTAFIVRVTEGTPPPQVETGGVCGDVVASQDCILFSLCVFAGTPAVKEGNFVHAGEIIIKGEEKSADGQVIPVKARGEARGRVWLRGQADLYENEYISLQTGNVWERDVLSCPFGAFSFKEQPDYLTSECDMRLIPLAGVWFPVTLVRERYSEVYLEENARDMEALQHESAVAALRLAQEKVQYNDETVDKWIDYSMIKEGFFSAFVTIEVLRDVARFVPFEQ